MKTAKICSVISKIFFFITLTFCAVANLAAADKKPVSVKQANLILSRDLALKFGITVNFHSSVSDEEKNAFYSSLMDQCKKIESEPHTGAKLNLELIYARGFETRSHSRKMNLGMVMKNQFLPGDLTQAKNIIFVDKSNQELIDKDGADKIQFPNGKTLKDKLLTDIEGGSTLARIAIGDAPTKEKPDNKIVLSYYEVAQSDSLKELRELQASSMRAIPLTQIIQPVPSDNGTNNVVFTVKEFPLGLAMKGRPIAIGADEGNNDRWYFGQDALSPIPGGTQGFYIFDSTQAFQALLAYDKKIQTSKIFKDLAKKQAADCSTDL